MKLIPRRVRMAWKVLTGRSAFKGAEVNRLLLDWVAKTLTADEEIKGSIRKIRARARELCRNEGYAKQYLRLLTVNVVGPQGIRLQSRVKTADGKPDLETNRKIETAWKAWAKGKVTIDGRHNLRQFENILVRAVARDGECFVRKWFAFKDNPFGLALQFLDADQLDETYNRARRLQNNEIRMGVEVDELGRVVGYWFSKPKDRTNFDIGPAERFFVKAEEILHIYDSDRPNQTRGVSWLHSTMVPLKIMGGYEESEAVAARTAAAKMGFIQKAEGSGAMTQTQNADMEAAPGSIEELPEGWTFKEWNPDHPTSAFGAFIKGMLRKIASGWGVLYNALANDLEHVNYSSLRSGAIEARDFYRTLQQELIDQFLDPIYRDWLNMALLTRMLQLPSMDFRLYAEGAIWQPKGWQWVDPLKEISGAEKAIDRGLDSRTRLAAERGQDIEEIFDDLANEQAMAEERGLTISGKSSVDVQPNPESDEGETGAGRTLLALPSRE